MRSAQAWILTISKVKRTGRFFLVLVLLSSGLGTAEGWAQNLLGNPNFDDAATLANWNPFGGANGTRIHDPAEDVGGVAASGAAEISLNAGTLDGTQVGISQCVVVTANTLYNYGTRVKMPNDGQPTDEVDAWIDVEFFSDGGCTTSVVVGDGQGGTIGSVNYPLGTTWHGMPGTVPGTAQTVTAPAGAGGVLVRLYVERFTGTAVATAFFDNPFFGVNVTPVEVQEFVVE